MLRAISIVLLVLISTGALAGTRIASWNLKHLGWNNGKNLDAVAQVVGHFDLVAIQEVMDPAAARKLASLVSKKTGEPWGVTTSQLEGDSTYKESYAFIWRKSAVTHDGGDSAYLDPGNKFAREPFTAEFTAKDSQTQLTLGTVHISYGDSRSDRTSEIRVLNDYWKWMGSNYQGPRLLMGDFNMAPTDASWRAMDQAATPSIRSGASTLSQTDGKYAHLYDNIWRSSNGALPVTAAGIFRYPKVLGISHRVAYATISDHAPVYIVLGNATVDTGTESSELALRSTEGPKCIDVNSATAKYLDKLDHVGPVTAARIVAQRPFASLDDLTKVSGLSSGYVADIKKDGRACPIGR